MSRTIQMSSLALSLSQTSRSFSLGIPSLGFRTVLSALRSSQSQSLIILSTPKHLFRLASWSPSAFALQQTGGSYKG